MSPVVRESDVLATPGTIWNTCFSDMKWEKWDPDVTELVCIEGGCIEGGTFNFVMKEGPLKIVPCSMSNVKAEKSLTFSGAAMSGFMKFSGTIDLTPKDDSTTTVKYSFLMSGLLGYMIAWFNPAVVKGTEMGLANIVRLSEEAGNNSK